MQLYFSGLPLLAVFASVGVDGYDGTAEM